MIKTVTGTVPVETVPVDVLWFGAAAQSNPNPTGMVQPLSVLIPKTGMELRKNVTMNATEYRYRQNLGCDNASEYKHHQKESMDCEELLRVHTSCHWKPRNRIYKCM